MTNTLSPPRPSVALRTVAFRPILVLLAAFIAVSCGMEVVLIVRSATGLDVDTAVWIRCSLVLASSVTLFLFAVVASRGSRTAWIRLRIISAVVVAAVIVIVSIPGFLPDWVRIEQAVCGILVLPAAVIVNLPRFAALFPKRA
jgi:hypothetical protein